MIEQIGKFIAGWLIVHGYVTDFIAAYIFQQLFLLVWVSSLIVRDARLFVKYGLPVIKGWVKQ